MLKDLPPDSGNIFSKEPLAHLLLSASTSSTLHHDETPTTSIWLQSVVSWSFTLVLALAGHRVEFRMAVCSSLGQALVCNF